MTLLYMIQALPFISTCPCILHIQSFLGLGKIDVPILQKRKSSLRDIVAWLITKLELEPKTHNSPFRTLESHLNTSATSLPCSGIGWSQQMKVKNCSRQKIDLPQLPASVTTGHAAASTHALTHASYVSSTP